MSPERDKSNLSLFLALSNAILANDDPRIDEYPLNIYSTLRESPGLSLQMFRSHLRSSAVATDTRGIIAIIRQANCSRVARYMRYLRKIVAHEACIPYRFVDGVTESADIPMPECDDFDSEGERGGEWNGRAGVRGVRAMTEKLRRETSRADEPQTSGLTLRVID